MTLKLIDPSTWSRKEYFDHYMHSVNCSYSMTLNLDLTGLFREIKNRKIKLYPTMIYLLSSIVNKHEEFRMAMDANGEVGIFDFLHPCYTVFQKDSETFTNIWTEYTPSFSEFYQRYLLDVQTYGDIKKFIAKESLPSNSFTVSSIPWVNFTGFHLHLPRSADYLLPIFTIGKYVEQEGKINLPLAIQVHHAVCDGYHVARLIQELQQAMDQLFTAL